METVTHRLAQRRPMDCGFPRNVMSPAGRCEDAESGPAFRKSRSGEAGLVATKVETLSVETATAGALRHRQGVL